MKISSILFPGLYWWEKRQLITETPSGYKLKRFRCNSQKFLLPLPNGPEKRKTILLCVAEAAKEGNDGDGQGSMLRLINLSMMARGKVECLKHGAKLITAEKC